MKSIINSLIQEFRALVRDERGLTIVEYAVAGAVVAGVVATAFSDLGTGISTSLGKVVTLITK
jgi:pilus assembly protein Flp/PilA